MRLIIQEELNKRSQSSRRQRGAAEGGCAKGCDQDIQAAPSSAQRRLRRCFFDSLGDLRVLLFKLNWGAGGSPPWESRAHMKVPLYVAIVSALMFVAAGLPAQEETDRLARVTETA